MSFIPNSFQDRQLHEDTKVRCSTPKTLKSTKTITTPLRSHFGKLIIQLSDSRTQATLSSNEQEAALEFIPLGQYNKRLLMQLWIFLT